MVGMLQISIVDNKNNKNLSIIQKSVVIAIQSDKKFIFKSDGITLGPQGTAFHTIFSGKIICVKRPQLSKTAKNRTIAPTA